MSLYRQVTTKEARRIVDQVDPRKYRSIPEGVVRAIYTVNAEYNDSSYDVEMALRFQDTSGNVSEAVPMELDEKEDLMRMFNGKEDPYEGGYLSKDCWFFDNDPPYGETVTIDLTKPPVNLFVREDEY